MTISQQQLTDLYLRLQRNGYIAEANRVSAYNLGDPKLAEMLDPAVPWYKFYNIPASLAPEWGTYPEWIARRRGLENIRNVWASMQGGGPVIAPGISEAFDPLGTSIASQVDAASLSDESAAAYGLGPLAANNDPLAGSLTTETGGAAGASGDAETGGSSVGGGIAVVALGVAVLVGIALLAGGRSG